MTLTNYMGPGGDVVIPGTLGGYPVTCIGAAAFGLQGSVTSITIPTNVASIEDSAFYRCTGLTSMTLPNGLTNIGPSVFSECHGLTNIGIPDTATAIGEYAFLDCWSLPTLVLPTGLATLQEGVFQGCIGLTNLSIPGGVTSVGASAFARCTSLNNLVIPSSVNNIAGGAFLYCSALTTLYFAGNPPLPLNGNPFSDSYSTNTVTTVYYYLGNTSWEAAFCGRPTMAVSAPATGFSYAYVTNSGIVTVTITGYGGADTFITLPSIINGFPVNSIGQSAFYWWHKNLTTINIPPGVTNIGDGAFSYCTGLTSLTFPMGVTNIGKSMFFNCESLTNVTIPGTVTSLGENAFHECTGLKDIVIPDSVTEMGAFCFGYCSSLTNITVPASVTYIDYDAFEYCTNLTGVYFDGNPPSVNGGAFPGTPATVYYQSGTTGWSDTFCGQPTFALPPLGCAYAYETNGSSISITISAYTNPPSAVSLPSIIDVYPVTSIGDGAFLRCASVTSITIPNSVTSIGAGAFAECSNLTSITLPDSLTNLDNDALVGCVSMGCLTLPSGLTLVSQELCAYCSGLTNVTIPPGVVEVGTHAFAACSNLASITLPNSVTNLGAEAFVACESLRAVTLPDNLTSIGEGMFAFCGSLSNITIPASVAALDPGTLYGCSNLTAVCFLGNAPNYGADILGDSNFTNTTTMVYYYLGTAGWSNTFCGRPTVGLSQAPTITTSPSLPPGTACSAYSQALCATNGRGPYTWSIVSGRLPLGLFLSTNGVLSGTPKLAGTNSVTIRCTGSTGYTTDSVVTLRVGNTKLSAPLAAVTYNGLFYPLTEYPSLTNSGAVTLAVNNAKKGAFSGKLRMVAGQFSFSGSFDTNSGHALATNTTKGAAGYVIELQLDNSGGLPGISGTVSNCARGWVCELELERAAARTTFSSALSGNRLYTLAMPPGTNAAVQPGGWSTFCGSLSKAGMLSLAGTLGDGSKVSQAGVVSTEAQFPLFILPYSGKGLVMGWLDFTLTNATAGGDVLWIRPANSAQPYYQKGFVVTNSLAGEIYTAPGTGQNALTLTNGGCVLQDGGLPACLTNNLTLVKNKAVFVQGRNPNQMSLTINPANGAVSGSFKLSSGKKASISGVVWPQRQEAVGAFLGADQAGCLMVR